MRKQKYERRDDREGTRERRNGREKTEEKKRERRNKTEEMGEKNKRENMFKRGQNSNKSIKHLHYIH